MRLIDGVPMIGLLLDRLQRAHYVDEMVVTTSKSAENDSLAQYCSSLGHSVFRGNEADVLDRYYQAAVEFQADTIVRITGDCPLADPGLIDEMVQQFHSGKSDYLSNVVPATYPDGLDVEVFSFAALETAWTFATRPEQREHVTPFLREAPNITRANVAFAENLSSHRWTVDEPEDLTVIENVFKFFAPRRDFTWEEVLKLEETNPSVFQANRSVPRNEGQDRGTGQKLWKRAKRVIPGGNMLLSKRSEMFLPEQWPSYFSRSKGCKVWDLDNNEYVDMSIMGIGTNSLGYSHPEVDEAVRGAISAGNMSTFNCPEEVYLAERLIELHPWADMVKFARTGGEANAVAIRIARAATGREKVAVCGYHGWHDWYLAANLGDQHNLAGHLLPGLEPNGVPTALSGTVFPFEYNNFAQLQQLVESNEIGVIKMEVSRNAPPADGFLERVRELATEKGIVLIFDECTSGFRQTFGGLHKMYGVEPDMALFGKALGNGYAITAVIGRRSVMEAAQATFISSTFWTERIGPAAGLKTLEVMERESSWEQITQTGRGISERWASLAAIHGLPIVVSGLPALTTFTFPVADWLGYKSLITQEMLKVGYLATNVVYVCTEHNDAYIDRYFDLLDPIFGMIKECESGRPVAELLQGPACHAGFKRLN